MKNSIFLGALTGASLAGWLCLLEAAVVLAQFPYERDFGLLLHALPSYLVIGTIAGICAALLRPILTRKSDYIRQPWLHLGLLVLTGVSLTSFLFLAQTEWLPLKFSVTSNASLILSGKILLAHMLAYGVLYRLATSQFGWSTASFFAPLSQALLLALVVLIAGLASFLPTQASSNSPKAAQVAAPTAPNVLLIVLDTVAAKHLGCYGYYRPTSPALDSFAAESVLFENAFSAAPWTLPSHASLFTGLHPTTHKTGWNRPRLEDGNTTCREYASHGFHTLAEELTQRGWQTFGASEKSWITSSSGLTRGFQYYRDFSLPSAIERMALSGWLGRQFGPPFADVLPPDKGGARLTQTVLQWLEKERDTQQPFFAFLNLNEAHSPYIPPADLRDHFLPKDIDPAATLALVQDASYRKNLICGLRREEPHEPDILRALYDAEILYQDRLLQKLFQGLRDLDLMEDTLVIVTSDHGEEFGEQSQRYGHQGSLADRLLHVPLLMRYPSLLPAGKRISSLASSVDVFSTILDVLETVTKETPPQSADLLTLEGVSQLTAMRESKPARNMVLAHYAQPATYYQGFPSWDHTSPDSFPLFNWIHEATSIRTIDEKMIVYGNGEFSWVDLKRDPNENAGEKKLPAQSQSARALEMGQQLRGFLNGYHLRRNLLISPFGKSAHPDKSPKHKHSQQAIEQLGYTGENDELTTDLAEQDGSRVIPFVR